MTTMIDTLLNTELATAKLLQAASGYTCSIGSIPDNLIWGSLAPSLKNGNTFLVQRGAAVNQIKIAASGVFYTSNLSVYSALTLLADKTITSILVPGGARTSGGNYFWSEVAPFSESLSILAGYYNHIYFISDSPVKFGVIATTTAAAPDALLSTFITGTVNQDATTNPRQAVCYVDALGNVVGLTSFPRMVNGVATVGPTSGPSFVDWRTNAVALTPSNAVQATFVFPGGTGTGEVGEIAVSLGSDLIAYRTINPQVLKDADVDLTSIWNSVVGQPTVFIP